ncbi:ribonuclease [Lachnospiraceae bacterium XPB1003]|nr:ribonuclease [Lachnospiraceae bacterium XPB1003]
MKKGIKSLILSAILVLAVTIFAACGVNETVSAPADATVTEAPTADREGDEQTATEALTGDREGDELTATEAPTADPEGDAQAETSAAIDQNGTYTTAADVALYIHTYGKLPVNFITKNEAKALGWPGGSLEEYAPGKCIGGDYFGNYEGLLPDDDYHECDIDTLGKSSRGSKRIIYSDKGSIYYTEDHYESFTQLY